MNGVLGLTRLSVAPPASQPTCRPPANRRADPGRLSREQQSTCQHREHEHFLFDRQFQLQQGKSSVLASVVVGTIRDHSASYHTIQFHTPHLANVQLRSDRQATSTRVEQIEPPALILEHKTIQIRTKRLYRLYDTRPFAESAIARHTNLQIS
jgi:hypothetical protein